MYKEDNLALAIIQIVHLAAMDGHVSGGSREVG